MFSAATGRPLRAGLAVTGELSLHGNIVPIGGVPEKLYAALSHGRTTVLVPESNSDDLEQVPEITSKIKVHTVRTFAEAMQFALA